MYPKGISVDNKTKMYEWARVILELMDISFSSYKNSKGGEDCKILYTYFSNCIKPI
jgi:hypothetical protein